MLKQFFILLEEFATKPTSEVGQLAKSISLLTTHRIPTLNAVCLPSTTLKLIAQANNTKNKVYKLIQNTNFKSALSKRKAATKLKLLLTRQKIPQELANEFLKLYHHHFQSSFISIQSSNQINGAIHQLTNIKGDANLVDALLTIWAEIVASQFNKLLTNNIETKTLLFATPILIQQQLKADASGTAVSFDETNGSKKRFTIKGVWGIFNQNDKILASTNDTYFVDSRTLFLVKKIINPQPFQYARKLDQLGKKPLNSDQQKSNVLSDVQASELAQIISKVFRLSLAPVKLEWGRYNNQFFISRVQETNLKLKYNQTKIVKTLKKVYVSVNQTEIKLPAHLDGVCIFNTGEMLSLLGNHPMYTAKQKQKKYLLASITNVVEKYWNKSNHLIYRTQNYTSKQLQKLKYAANYEVTETNPDLGLRGAAKILAQPQMFNLELEIVKQLLTHTTKPSKPLTLSTPSQQSNKISLLIPFVRSANEAQLVIRLVEKAKLFNNHQFNIWLELSTPASIFNLAEYPLNKIAGVVFNTRSIYSLMLGIDPYNKNIFTRYSNNTSFIIDLLKNTVLTLEQFAQKKLLINKHQLLVDLTGFDQGIINDVIKEEIAGIIVNRKLTDIAKKCIINEEEKIWQK